jgi:hypothetical protein
MCRLAWKLIYITKLFEMLIPREDQHGRDSDTGNEDLKGIHLRSALQIALRIERWAAEGSQRDGG